MLRILLETSFQWKLYKYVIFFLFSPNLIFFLVMIHPPLCLTVPFFVGAFWWKSMPMYLVDGKSSEKYLTTSAKMDYFCTLAPSCTDYRFGWILILPLFRPKWPIVVFRKSSFPLDISKCTKCIAVKFYRTSVYHYVAFTCKILQLSTL